MQTGARAPRCVFDGGRCALNPAFPTNLPAPTTDTQKLIAYTYWLAGRQCDAATSQQSCEQLHDDGQGCVWNSEHEDCSLFWTPNKNWLSNNVVCPGSLAAAAADCTAAVYGSQSSYNTTAATAPLLRCASRPGCVWLPGSSVSPPPPPAAPANGTAVRSTNEPAAADGNGTASTPTVSDLPIALLIPHLLASFYDRAWADGVFAKEAPPVAAGVCVPQWVVEAEGSRSRALQGRIDAGELRRLLAGLTTDSATLYLPVYDELFGTCTGAQRAKQYLASADASCRSYDEPDTCVDNMACGWSDGIVAAFPNGAPSEGACEAETGFVWELLYDQNDAWVKAINAAAQPCATAGTNPAACASAGGTIPVDYAVLDSYGTVRPSWLAADGGSGLDEGVGGSGIRGGNGNSAHAAAPSCVLVVALALLAGLLAAAVPGTL